ncbi:MAG: hypothetical protein ACOYNY_22590 [Caldilineaceae bacterium]
MKYANDPILHFIFGDLIDKEPIPPLQGDRLFVLAEDKVLAV